LPLAGEAPIVAALAWKRRQRVKLDLEGKVVLVTGGSKGIGLSCARAFLAEGAKVAIASRSRENLERASAGSGATLWVAADLTRADAARDMVREVVDKLGAVDILVNSAGAAKRYLPDELDASAWHAAMDAKYFTYIHAMDAVLPGMAARSQGSVVNVIGMGGKVATPIHLPGGAANSALMLATVGLSQVYAPKGIRINAVNPGATLTDRVKEALRLEASVRKTTEDEVLASAQARVPLRRFANAEEIANVVLFLSSQRASYITGAIIPMDGGSNPVI
jgi:NAD(P)-dependent dehydrogenase (short-subunit alcohol dehydrogenase family)